MSFLNLNHNIVRLRKEKGITQEQLADFAGVTKASVSKWETGATTPDIEMLPILAAFFDISVDELLGYEAQLSTKQIQYYYHKLAQKFAESDFDEVWNESMELVKKYYGCYSFLMQMAILWLNHYPLAEEEKRQEILVHIEELCIRIEENSDDKGLTENAAEVKNIVWLQQGKSNQIIKSLEKDVLNVNRMGDKGQMLSLAYLSAGDLTMAKKCSQIGLYRNLMEMIGQCIYLLMSNQNDEAYCREVLKRTDLLLKVFEMDRLNPNTAAGYEYQAALTLCGFLPLKDSAKSKEDLENDIFIRIESFVQMVCNLYADGIQLHADNFFFQLTDWFRGLDLGVEGVRDGKIVLTDTIASLKHPAFLTLQDADRLNRCIKRLQDLI